MTHRIVHQPRPGRRRFAIEDLLSIPRVCSPAVSAGGNLAVAVTTQDVEANRGAGRIYFEDENHWILKPQNAIRWYGEVLEWLDRFLSC